MENEIEFMLEDYFELAKDEKTQDWVNSKGKVVCSKKQFKKALNIIMKNGRLWEFINDCIINTLEDVGVQHE